MRTSRRCPEGSRGVARAPGRQVYALFDPLPEDEDDKPEEKKEEAKDSGKKGKDKAGKKEIQKKQKQVWSA